MKLLFDFLPIILFFAAYKLAGIFVATGVAIAASLLLIGFIYLKGRKPDIMQWVSIGVIVVFGGATILLHNETFIKWKPTVLYLLMGLALAGAQLLFKRNLLKLLMGEQIALPEPVWIRLNWMWVGFFMFMAALNLVVAYQFSTDIWVNFKLFGGIGLMIVFVIAQSLYLSRYIQEDSPAVKASSDES